MATYPRPQPWIDAMWGLERLRPTVAPTVADGPARRV